MSPFCWPQVVPDVLLSQSLQKVEAPKAATSSRSVLAGIMNTPASMRRYKVRAAGQSRASRVRLCEARSKALHRPLLPGQSLGPFPRPPASLQFAIEQARFYDKCDLASGGDKTACQVSSGRHWQQAVPSAAGGSRPACRALPPVQGGKAPVFAFLL